MGINATTAIAIRQTHSPVVLCLKNSFKVTIKLILFLSKVKRNATVVLHKKLGIRNETIVNEEVAADEVVKIEASNTVFKVYTIQVKKERINARVRNLPESPRAIKARTSAKIGLSIKKYIITTELSAPMGISGGCKPKNLATMPPIIIPTMKVKPQSISFPRFVRILLTVI